ncbi:hypothetical protein OCV67_12525 [Porcipelethomonas ammoniilytica]|uniref:DUF7666 domain-containing protein n=1 Tax=Porcipelethomonas ammoniilytica TaxID=2981722 RepID=UPI0008223EAB|nr:hypothetical protein [Porcipelethomonas ammoniilytica]MCU6720742.1 hypothetical protein [Porcipelethomonas ammoniilytica]SCJ23547.1 Uncharacterised protein [uncultured Ruminococcus sp.]
MKGYKGFEPGLICRGKQYAENTVFEEEEAKICSCGMHFCENPFDVLDYYGFTNDNGDFNEFAEVEALDEEKTNDNRKFCTKKLKIGAKLSISKFINACVDFAIEKTSTCIADNKISSGDSARIGSSGYFAQIGSSGDFAQIGSSGDSARIGSSGDSARIGSSGNSAQIGSSGYFAQIGSSGDSAQIGSSGNSARIGSSGDSAQIGSSGDSARIGSSGNFAKIGSSGKDCVICCAGHNSVVKAKKGSWITLAEWEYSEEKERYIPKCVKTEFVDGERIKEDTLYKLIDGEFVEV